MDNQQVEGKKPIYKKKWFLITVGIIVVIGLLPKGNNGDKGNSTNEKQVVENTNTVSGKSEDNSKETIKQPPSLESKISKEIESIKNGVDFTSYRGDVTSLQIETTLFKLWGDLVKEGLNSSNPNDVKLSNQLKKLVSQTQVKELPIIRKEYVNIIKEKLWEDNIKVSSSGKGNTTINLSGGSFFNNKNKSEVQKTISEILSLFRFKQSTYRGYDGQDEYTYYTLDTPNDNELY